MSFAWPGPDDFEAYRAPSLPQPPRGESELLEDVVAERRERGLPVDPESVARAIENSRRPDYPLPGIHYTAEEQVESEAFDRELGDRAQALLIDAGAELGSVALGWVAGRRVVELSVKHDVERYHELLRRELDSDRVLLKPARYSYRELDELRDQITRDSDELRALGVDLWSSAPAEDGVEICFFAADRARSERLLKERYGPAVKADWTGPSRLAEEPQPFGSWIGDGTELTVFYPLPHNGEQPGHCTAEEHADRVVVTLTILVPQGATTLVGGFKPTHATATLTAPVGDRSVIDAAHDRPRPRWTGTPSDG